MQNQKSLIDHCKERLSQKFGVNGTAVKTDMDAISILMSTKNMTPERRTGMKEFLNLFGNELTLRATLPNSVTGSSTEGIFGCKEDKKCMHLPPPITGQGSIGHIHTCQNCGASIMQTTIVAESQEQRHSFYAIRQSRSVF